MIDYTIDDGRGNTTEYRLLPPCWTRRPPADAVAAGYAQRWEMESTFDELKTHQRGPKMVLRSKSPDLVRRRSGATCAATSPSVP